MARDARGRQHVPPLVSVQSALRYVILTLALACFGGVAFSQDPAATTAQRVAREWLALTDAGNAAASWDAAARQFKNAMTRDGWAEALHTLLHEMVHQWQAETGLAVNHGRSFRRKAREVGIEPQARRRVDRRGDEAARV